MAGRILLAALVVAALIGPDPGTGPEPPPPFTRYPAEAYPITVRFGGLAGIAGQRLAEPNPGIDIIARVRTPVHAAGFGVVARVATEPDRGRVVEIATIGTDPPYWMIYAHLHEVTVTPGAPVRAGAEIGQVGDTGQVPRGIAHLRFELRLTDGRPVNPEPFLRSRPDGLIECADAELAARHPTEGGYALNRFAEALAGTRKGAPLLYPVACVRE